MADAVLLEPLSEPALDALLSLNAAFCAETGLEHDPVTARACLNELLQHPDWGRAWLILLAGEPVGYLVLCLGYSLEFGGRDAYLDELYLLPAVRGRGVARRGLELALGEARRLGVKAVHLEAAPVNEGAMRLYQGLGFLPRSAYRLLTRRL